MFLTITTTHEPATDLGFLLHKNPARPQFVDSSVGRAHVYYPEATERRCTVAVQLDVDPIALVRGRRGGSAASVAHFVNDRPYAASSLLAVALGRLFGTALGGRCAARPELARTPIPLDPTVPEWGDSPYLALRLTGVLRLADALAHLVVMLPVLDGSKHYWVGGDEVDKLLRTAGGWLPGHPERDLITRRYLAHDRDLVLSAVGRLAEVDGSSPAEIDNAVPDDAVEGADEPADRPLSLAATRRGAVLAALRAAGAVSVLDLGCGEGALMRDLLADPAFTRILGIDVSDRALRTASRRLRLDRLPDRQRAKVELVQGSLTYRDERLAGFDAAVLMEVVEHVDPPRLPTLARVVFGHARPRTVVVTTPNREHNVRFETLAAGTMRHRDHRFEWDRAEFGAWAREVAEAHGYDVRFLPVGADDPQVGPPTQAAVFSRMAAGS